jgi:hypothetical protein
MTYVEILDAARDRAGGYKVDVNRGKRVGRVSDGIKANFLKPFGKKAKGP